jgi:hypothetical protein
MALHLNLNHELVRARAEARRDPLKLTMMGLIFVAALFVLQFFWTMSTAALSTHERDGKRKQFAEMDPRATAATAEEVELRKKLGNSERLQKRIEGRFYWAPLLQVVVENVPGNIHVTRFAGDVNIEDSSKVQFKIEGLVAGAEPRGIAENFRQKLGQVLEKNYHNVTATFRHLEDGTETVQIEGKPTPTATFAINVQMQHGQAVAPTPPPREPRKP